MVDNYKNKFSPSLNLTRTGCGLERNKKSPANHDPAGLA
jgi:hypothetical protein